MNYIKNVKPGDIVVSDFGIYQHWSIVSDAICSKNKYMLISATNRCKTVREESWDEVTKGKNTYIVDLGHSLSVKEILLKARSYIGIWDYSLFSRNCEHFINLIVGNKIKSNQVEGAVLGLVVGTMVTKLFLKKESKFLSSLILFGTMLMGLEVTKANGNKRIKN